MLIKANLIIKRPSLKRDIIGAKSANNINIIFAFFEVFFDGLQV